MAIATAVAVFALAQVTAGTAQGSAGRQEIADPMAIEVSLGPDVDLRGLPRESFEQQPLGKARAYPETDRFVCDQARVRMLTVKKVSQDSSELLVEAAVTLVTEWPLQDVDLTVALVDREGRVVAQRFWNDLTVGSWSRSYTPPKAQFRVSNKDWQGLFADGAVPKLRITVDIQE